MLVGLLALARFSLALSSWDTGSGFALMASARDLTIAVVGEALLLLALLLVAATAASTDLVSISTATAGSAVWSEPGHWCAAVAFGLALLVETGRQPIDNPDTHLELTMIHEGPLLEYGGRDLAMLQWTAAARHWIFLVLGASIFLPHSGGFAAQLGWTVSVGRRPGGRARSARDRPGEDEDPEGAGAARRRLPPGADRPRQHR